MPRKQLIYTTEFPYHITSRSNNREFFYIELPKLWEIFCEKLHLLQQLYGVEVHAFVMMSNHYHLLISTPNANIGEAMKYFHREVAREVNRCTGRINHFFGGRYKWSLIAKENYYWNAIKYVFRNPVRAGICGSVDDYCYSSLVSGARYFDWNLCDFFIDKSKPIGLDRDWLNEPFLTEQEEAIRKGLRRHEFTLPATESGRLVVLGDMRRK